MRTRRLLAVLCWLVLVCSLALFLAGCRPVTRPAPTEAAAPATPEIEPAHKALIEQYVDIWNAPGAEVSEAFTPDFVLHNADVPDMYDVAGIQTRAAAVHEGVPDFRQNLLDLFGDGEWYLFRSELAGTVDGQPISFGSMNLVHILDNRIAEAWAVSDEVAVERMGGYFPNPEGRFDFTWGDTSPATGTAGDPAANRALVEQWWAGDDTTRQALAHDQYAFHSTQYPGQNDFAGRQTAMTDLRSAFSDVQMAIDEPVVTAGDKVAFKLTATGTNDGSLFGLDPSGRQFTWPGIAIYRIVDGKIADEWILWSMSNLFYQIQ